MANLQPLLEEAIDWKVPMKKLFGDSIHVAPESSEVYTAPSVEDQNQLKYKWRLVHEVIKHALQYK